MRINTGHFVVFVLCVSNEVVSFNKESYIFSNFDHSSDAHNPRFKEEPIVFGQLDLTDESSFNLIILVQVKKVGDTFTYHIYGINVLPVVTTSDTILNGIFEVPLLDLELNFSLFQELNNISPWQFQMRYLKEKKAKTLPISVIFRQNNTDLADMYPRTSFLDEINRFFMPSSESTPSLKSKSRQQPTQLIISDFLHKNINRREMESEIKQIIKNLIYTE